MPHVFVRWLTDPGDVVYDPFGGRGTTALEARVLGRVAYVSDANPLAWILSSAKADPPTRMAVQRRLADLERRMDPGDPSREPEQIRMLFSARTLGQLLWLRGQLDTRRRVDRFLLAGLLGMLHLRADAAGVPRGFTVAMPNTFSMAPGYISRYITTNGLRPPDVDVVPALRSRLATFPLSAEGETIPGKAWLQDATARIQGPVAKSHAKLIFTSPPYLEVMRYGKLNWIRLWLLGEDPATVDSRLFASSSIDGYLRFLTTAVRQMRSVLRSDGYLCLVIGDVRRGSTDVNLAEKVASTCIEGTDLTVVGVVRDDLPTQHKVSRIWGGKKGQATKTDRIIILAGPEAVSVPDLPRIQWTVRAEAETGAAE
jgi:site-specific DNA-methyltransferase (adenine-specific)